MPWWFTPLREPNSVWRSLLIMPVVGLVLHDIIVGVAAVVPGWSRRPLAVIGAGAAALAALAAAGFMFAAAREIYRSKTPLGLPGAWRLRLTSDAVAEYRFLTGNLKSPQRDFLTMPGLNSLYFSAQKQPPTGLNPMAWMLQLSDPQQEQVIASVRDKPDLWAVSWPAATAWWITGQDIDHKPLVRFIRSECRKVNSVAGIELRARAAHASGELLQCVHWRRANEPPTEGSPGIARRECRISLALAQHGLLGAVAVVDLMTGQVLARSQPAPGGSPPRSLDGVTQIPFTASVPKAISTSGFFGAVLMSPDGKWLDILPFLDEADLGETSAPKAKEVPAYHLTHDWDDTIAFLTEAIRLDPKCAEAYSNRGLAYLVTGKLDQAVADYSEAIRLDPNVAEVHYNRGCADAQQGSPDRAIADFSAAIRLAPKLAKAYNNRGFAYMVKGSLDQAVADFSAAICLDPTSAHAFNNRGMAYQRLGQSDKAKRDFAKARELEHKP